MGTQFKGTIQIGIGCNDSLLKKDGDILFATHSNALLISDGKVYLDGKLQLEISTVDWRVIRNALIQVADAMLTASCECKVCKKEG